MKKDDRAGDFHRHRLCHLHRLVAVASSVSQQHPARA
jgi:hypothetical protein